ncbi:MAG: glycosyltransferase [Candidatus Krumholzibacteriota bacterium]|nr:glycosyltransferase [Candidatus Krumholzibacteriota bacterium]
MGVVWFSEIKWDYLRTRKQQIIRRRPEDVSLLYLEPWVRGRENRFDLREVDGIRVATVPFVKAVPGGLARTAINIPVVRALVDRYAVRRAAAVLKQAGLLVRRPALVISNIYAAACALSFQRSTLAYDCNDAHTAFPGMPGWTRSYYERTCRGADAVFTTSEALRNDVALVRGGEAGVELIGNGVEFGHFDRVRRELGPRVGGGVHVGYVGAIAPWFDFDSVAELARRHSDWKITLVGPVILGAQTNVTELDALDNVSLRPPVSYDDVPRVLHEFTIGIIPFRLDELTRGVNPNKMYEYLAMGLPVAATKFSTEVGRFPETVKTGRGGDEFVRACEEAVQLAEGDPAHRERAVREASRFDWDQIAGRFWSRLRQLDSGEVSP